MEQDKYLKILFFGDVVGRPGRMVLQKFLNDNLEKYSLDFIIANIENASHGFGLTEKNYEEISSMGINCMTSGNHIWDKKDIYDYIDRADKLIRPINYPDAQGKGYGIFETPKGKVGVINILGRNFMPVIDSPRYITEKAIEEIKKETDIIFIDFHAEATAEKQCYARYFSEMGISAFVGTHTHVQTADNDIINGRTAYISDAGFCGDNDGIIGMDYPSSLKRILTMLPERFEVASSENFIVNAVLISVNTENGYAEDIKRIYEKIQL